MLRLIKIVLKFCFLLFNNLKLVVIGVIIKFWICKFVKVIVFLVLWIIVLGFEYMVVCNFKWIVIIFWGFLILLKLLIVKLCKIRLIIFCFGGRFWVIVVEVMLMMF